MKAKEKALLIEKAIKLAYGSLESHLPFTHKKTKLGMGANHFHKKCVKEYAELISILSKLY